MRRTVLSLLLVLVLVAASATALAQPTDKGRPPTTPPGQQPEREEAPSGEEEAPEDTDGQGRGRGQGQGQGQGRGGDDGAGDTQDGATDSGNGRGQGQGQGQGRGGAAGPEARPPVPLGNFSLEARDRTVSGEFVAFTYNHTGISEFTTRGVSLFDMEVVEVESDEKELQEGARTRVRGAEVQLHTPAFRLKAHDNPGAVVKLETPGKSIVRFAPGTELTLRNGDQIRFTVHNLTGTLKGDGLAIEGNSVRSADGFLLFLDEPRGKFDKHRPAIGQAIGKGHVGAEVSINKAAEGVQSEAVSYGNVTITPVRAERGNLTLLVEGHGTEGRVLVLNVDPRVIGAQGSQDLHILLDNLSIPQADGLEDILDPDNDGYTPEYYLVFDPGEEAFQLIVSVPHYSVHTLSVTTAFVLPPPSVVIGIVAGLFVLVPGAYVLFRPRRD